MNLIGQKVIHKTFGEGLIIDTTDNYLTIVFSQGEKKFIFPDAFNCFLSAVENSTDQAIKSLIAEKELAFMYASEENRRQEKTETINNAAKPLFNRKRIPFASGKTKKGSHGQQYFFVFQNKTFAAERSGGFLWAPKSTSDGHTKSHWLLMKDVCSGDIIFHSLNKNIVAISVAMTDCYSAIQPKSLKHERMWEDDGWRVDSKYILISYPIVTSDYMDSFLELQPKKYAPFNYLGRGNTGYLFAANYAMAQFMFDKLCVNNSCLIEFANDFGLE